MPKKKGNLYYMRTDRARNSGDFPMVIDYKENEDEGHPWPIRGRVIWVLNRFIEEPKR
jgi:hypothetical protein